MEIKQVLPLAILTKVFELVEREDNRYETEANESNRFCLIKVTKANLVNPEDTLFNVSIVIGEGILLADGQWFRIGDSRKQNWERKDLNAHIRKLTAELFANPIITFFLTIHHHSQYYQRLVVFSLSIFQKNCS